MNVDDWNTCEILAVGGKIRTALNGHLCVDMEDGKAMRRGITGLQMHAGAPLEVRFKELQLELNPKFEMTTVKQRAGRSSQFPAALESVEKAVCHAAPNGAWEILIRSVL